MGSVGWTKQNFEKLNDDALRRTQGTHSSDWMCSNICALGTKAQKFYCAPCLQNSQAQQCDAQQEVYSTVMDMCIKMNLCSWGVLLCENKPSSHNKADIKNEPEPLWNILDTMGNILKQCSPDSNPHINLASSQMAVCMNIVQMCMNMCIPSDSVLCWSKQWWDQSRGLWGSREQSHTLSPLCFHLLDGNKQRRHYSPISHVIHTHTHTDCSG